MAKKSISELVAKLLDWAARADFVWRYFPAEWTTGGVYAAVLAVVSAFLALLGNANAAQVFIYALSAAMIYVIAWSFVRMARNEVGQETAVVAGVRVVCLGTIAGGFWWTPTNRVSKTRIRLAVYLTLTNTQPLPLSIDRFSLEMQAPNVPSKWLRVRVMPSPPYGEIFTEGPGRWNPLVNTYFLDTLLATQTLEAGKPVAGWLFALYDGAVPPGPPVFRLSMVDSAGRRHKYDELAVESSEGEHRYLRNAQFMLGPDTDLSDVPTV